jgi:hypothetical protein
MKRKRWGLNRLRYIPGVCLVRLMKPTIILSQYIRCPWGDSNQALEYKSDVFLPLQPTARFDDADIMWHVTTSVQGGIGVLPVRGSPVQISARISAMTTDVFHHFHQPSEGKRHDSILYYAKILSFHILSNSVFIHYPIIWRCTVRASDVVK